MQAPITPTIISLRLVIAFLGEKKQFGWWDTSFLDSTGLSFLERPFPRTAFHAALRSSCAAAASVHDNAIGRVGAFHLFRFPVEREELFDIKLSSVQPEALLPLISSREAALSALGEVSSAEVTASTGPIQVGLENRLSAPAIAGGIGAYYRAAFLAATKTFPYFAKEKHA